MNKPECKLIGANGNIFSLLAIASRTLTRAGLRDEDQEMRDKVLASKSYDEALCIIGDYVEIV